VTLDTAGPGAYQLNITSSQYLNRPKVSLTTNPNNAAAIIYVGAFASVILESLEFVYTVYPSV
jgi:Ni,Fe-hydrogenase III small subunit